MSENDNLIRVFTGTEVLVTLLKSELEENGISTFVQDDFHSGVSARFIGGSPSAIDLYIQSVDSNKAEPIVKAFTQNNPD